MLLGFEILSLRVQNLQGLGIMNMTLPVWSANEQKPGEAFSLSLPKIEKKTIRTI
jgi:hypothetical protein